jgi:Outer membrane protein beta-barrel domain
MKKIMGKKGYNAVSNKIYLQIILGIALITASFNAVAQKKISFEIRPGINFATKNLGDASLKTGFGFEGAFAYKFMPHLAAYAGWSWNKFDAAKSFAGNDVNFEETGYTFGLQYMHPVANSKIGYMIKGGGTYNHIETESNDGKIINDTGHGLGWQFGAGVTIPVGYRCVFIPEVRYRSLSRDINIGEAKTPVDLNYISAGLGFSFSF